MYTRYRSFVQFTVLFVSCGTSLFEIVSMFHTNTHSKLQLFYQLSWRSKHLDIGVISHVIVNAHATGSLMANSQACDGHYVRNV
jgi:hypothetical protein